MLPDDLTVAVPARQVHAYHPCQNADRGLFLNPSRKQIRAMFALTAAALLAAGCGRMNDVPKDSSLAGRVGATAFLQLETDSFTNLTPRQQALAYWLTQSAIAIDPIIYDQMSRFGLRQKRLLEALVAHPQGIKTDVMTKISNFAKLFWANRGNHNDTTAQKFQPEFTFEELKEACSQLIKNGVRIGDPYGA